jgi:AcrR family transcriptional regulator
MNSNKTTKNLRGAVIPQRSHGKARVAAVLEAGAAVIAEKGYDAATMAEIAARAKAPIGSLYRFFPSKEILAQALIQRYAVLINEAFDSIDRRVDEVPVEAVADGLLDFMINLQDETKAMRGLLEARADWSDKRLEFRNLALKRLAKTISRYAPEMSRADAKDVAVIMLLNMKTMAALKFDKNIPTSPGAANELRLMNRLYLANKLGGRRATVGK